MMKKKLSIMTISILILCGVAGNAQTSLGTLKGTIYDDQEAVIVGARITISSNALLGVRTVKSGANGAYRVINLPPGDYKIEVSADNYKKMEVTNITINAGKVTAFNIKMEVGEFEETITIVGDAPLIDPSQPGKQFTYGGDLARSIAMHPRAEWYEILKSAPGISIESEVGRTDRSAVTVFGGGGQYLGGNNWTIDGAVAREVQFGSTRVKLSLDIIEEVSVETTRNNASSGATRGGSFNVVTKSGSNELAGVATLNYQSLDWNSSNVKDGTPKQVASFQPSFTLGGPVIKDNIWFFGNYQYSTFEKGIARTATEINTLKAVFPGFEPFNVDSTRYSFFGKISVGISDSQRADFTYQRSNLNELQEYSYVTETGNRKNTYEGSVMSGIWTWIPRDNFSVNVLVSLQENPRTLEPAVGDVTTGKTYSSGFFDWGGKIYADYPYLIDAPDYHWVQTMETAQAKITGNHFIEDLKGSHDFDFGLEYFHSKYGYQDGPYVTGGVPNGQIYVFLDPSDPGKGSRLAVESYKSAAWDSLDLNIVDNVGFYVNDAWQPISRLTVNAGLRFDSYSLERTVEAHGFSRDDGDRNGLSMNLGFSYSLTSDMKNIVRANYARRYDSLSQGTHGASTYISKGSVTTTNYIDYDGDGVFEFVATIPPSFRPTFYDLPVEQTLPYSDDILIGYSRELPWNSTISADFVFRKFKNDLTSATYSINHIIDSNGIWQGVKDSSIPGNYKGIDLMVNDTDMWRENYTFEVVFNKRFSNNLQMLASYNFDRGYTKGKWSSWSLARYWYGTDGKVRDIFGRGHMAKMTAVYIMPMGFTTSADVQIVQGEWSGPLSTRLPSSDPRISAHGPQFKIIDGELVFNPLYSAFRLWGKDRADGQWQTDTVYLVNWRLGKSWNIGGYRLDTNLDIFNLFNNDAKQRPAWGTRVPYGGVPSDNPNYGKNTSTIGARAGQITLRLTF